MKTPSDPTLHRFREQKLLEHVQRLLMDDRLRVDTTAGTRPVTALIRDVTRSDRAMDLKRKMADAGVYDRELQSRMPLGEMVEVTLSHKRFFFFRRTVGRVWVVCQSPVADLLKGDEGAPMKAADVSKLLASMPPSLGGVPQTFVVMSTSGFDPSAREMADRSAGRTVILVEPNGAGGWTVTAPPDVANLAELFDPEGEDEKRQRVRDAIDGSKTELLMGGLSTDKMATKLHVPEAVVEAELRAYAKANPGYAAKKLDGRFVLFREGTAATVNVPPAAGGSAMPLIDRVRALFARKGDDEKKVAFLSERRAALSQQVDREYEVLGALEMQEETLRTEFKEAAGSIKKKRLTSQLLQLRKDIERRQQLLAVLNNQINVVSTHLHNLELVQQGASANLPDNEEMTADAVKAEEMLAELEANAELAGSVRLSAGAGGLTAEEQELFEELEAEAKAEKGEKAKAEEAKAVEADKGGKVADKPTPAEPAKREATAAAPPPIPNRRQAELG